MPNWCSNNFYVYGDDKGQVLKFYLDMEKAISENPPFKKMQNSWDNRWNGNLFLAAGYSEKEVSNGTISCRGSIEDIQLHGDFAGVSLQTETAWGPNDESMQKMLDEKYPGLKMVYMAEEPGCEIYINTDLEGIYFSTAFMMEWTTDGNDWETDYYDSDLELAAALAGVLQVEEKEALDILHNGEVEEKFRQLYPEDKYPDSSICVHDYAAE